jgi:hypothetical protein
MKFTANSGVGEMTVAVILTQDINILWRIRGDEITYCIKNGSLACGEEEDHKRPPHPANSPIPQRLIVAASGQDIRETREHDVPRSGQKPPGAEISSLSEMKDCSQWLSEDWRCSDEGRNYWY